MRRAVEETRRRREIQMRYNREHGIEPRSISKPVRDLIAIEELDFVKLPERIPRDVKTEEELLKKIDRLEREMWNAAKNWEFEKAAKLRDEVRELKRLLNLN